MSLETEKVPWGDGKSYVVGGEITMYNKQIVVQGQVLVLPNIDEEGNDGYMSMDTQQCFHRNEKNQLVPADVCLTKRQKIQCNQIIKNWEMWEIIPFTI